MVLVCVKAGLWTCDANDKWNFVVDKVKRGRMVTLETTTLLEQLKLYVFEDYKVDHTINDCEFSYDMPNHVGNPPIIISNDRQLCNFVGFVKKASSTCLCVTFSATTITQKEGLHTDLNKEPCDASYVANDEVPEKEQAYFVKPSKEPFMKEHGTKDRDLVDFVKKGQIFKSKGFLKATMEICAMKNNFDYDVHKSTTQWWYIRCKDSLCNWYVRAESVEGSSYFKINQCERRHTCASSKRSNFGKKASAKTISSLIMHQYEGITEGPKPNDIIQFMRLEYGCDISYAHAWESCELAVAAVRGIPGKSYAKIPSDLHMIKEANPGTHTNYETDEDGRFKYLFLSFGQSVRGFYNAMRRVIVVDGTFLKYKGVLLVATAVDGNSNLYPIAFGVVDSENDNSWEWFLRQLSVVIGDDKGLAFVSDRNSSIAKALGNVYPRSIHGICIHHLLNNVVTFFKTRGLVGLIEKASRAYKYTDFQRQFGEIYEMSPDVGKYLQEADVRKWARCLFPGYRYDLRKTNAAESLNSVLRSPREYPIIPLLDSIRELMTQWFYERRELSSNHIDPLTIKVEKTINRRIEKAKGFQVFMTDEFRSVVKGDKYDCYVDLEKRTCTCGKYDLGKIPCRHAIPAIYSRGLEIHRYTSDLFFTSSWRTAYAESINPISTREFEWSVPEAIKALNVLPPESRRGAGRRRKRRYETVEDKIRSSQGSQSSKRHKCSRCGNEGHKRGTCDIPI